eukprot:scaffold274994_cov15-Tisochrysis_lutea.AAC.1
MRTTSSSQSRTARVSGSRALRAESSLPSYGPRGQEVHTPLSPQPAAGTRGNGRTSRFGALTSTPTTGRRPAGLLRSSTKD